MGTLFDKGRDLNIADKERLDAVRAKLDSVWDLMNKTDGQSVANLDGRSMALCRTYMQTAMHWYERAIRVGG